MGGTTNLTSKPTQSICFVLFAVFCCGLPTFGKYGGGTGTSNDPYQIADVNDLQEIGAEANKDDWDKYFILTDNINLSGFSGSQFNIIGNGIKSFTGSFDGDGHIISKFTYSVSGVHYIGLFGYLGAGAEIKNLYMLNADVDADIGSCDYVAVLAGYVNGGTITNCHTAGTVNGRHYIGGVVGLIEGGTILQSSAAVEVLANEKAGGLAGFNNNGSYILQCYATGDVTVSGGGKLVWRTGGK